MIKKKKNFLYLKYKVYQRLCIISTHDKSWIYAYELETKQQWTEEAVNEAIQKPYFGDISNRLEKGLQKLLQTHFYMSIDLDGKYFEKQ